MACNELWSNVHLQMWSWFPGSSRVSTATRTRQIPTLNTMSHFVSKCLFWHKLPFTPRHAFWTKRATSTRRSPCLTRGALSKCSTSTSAPNLRPESPDFPTVRTDSLTQIRIGQRIGAGDVVIIPKRWEGAMDFSTFRIRFPMLSTSSLFLTHCHRLITFPIIALSPQIFSPLPLLTLLLLPQPTLLLPLLLLPSPIYPLPHPHPGQTTTTQALTRTCRICLLWPPRLPLFHRPLQHPPSCRIALLLMEVVLALQVLEAQRRPLRLPRVPVARPVRRRVHAMNAGDPRRGCVCNFILHFLIIYWILSIITLNSAMAIRNSVEGVMWTASSALIHPTKRLRGSNTSARGSSNNAGSANCKSH